MRRMVGRTALVGGLVLAVPGFAAAQGYGVYEQGACTMARAGAAVANPCRDGSAIYFNPAALAAQQQKGTTTISLGGTLIAPRGGFTNTATGERSNLNDKYYPVPNVYITRGLTDRIAAGLGLFAPYGLETAWPTTAEGRFLGYRSKITGVYLQPTLSAEVTKGVYVGAGFDFSFVNVGLDRHVDLAAQAVPGAPPGVTFANLGIAPGTDFADVSLSGDSHGTGYHVGILLQPTDRVSFGGRYMSRQKMTFDNANAAITQIPTNLTLPAGNPVTGVPTPVDGLVASQFSGNGLLVTQSGTTTLRFPDQLVLGVSVKATDKATLMADWQYTWWSVFDALVLDFDRLPTTTLREDFRNTSGFRFGGEYLLTPTLTGRLGYYFHQNAAPDQSVTPNLPEGKRASFTAGLGTRVGKGLHLDVAYQYINQADRIGRSGDGNLAVPTTAQNNGLYTFHAHLFGATLSYAF